MSILEINEMIDMMEDHFSTNWGVRNHMMTVGGVAGTQIFQYAIDAALRYHDISKILIVDGCQDYIGLLRHQMHNYVYYMDLFQTVRIQQIEKQLNPYHEFPMELPCYYRKTLMDHLINGYDAMIIQNAHLIPPECIQAFDSFFCGKIVCIIDPLDFNGNDFCAIPTLYDSLTKQSPMIALARSMYDIDSRCIDRKVKGDFKRAKMSKRSIGKIDTNQYVTNSPDVLKQIQSKQFHAPYRKNQKFIVATNEITVFKDQNDALINVGPGSMFSIMSVTKPMLRLRLHSSRSQFYSTLSYRHTDMSLYVKPANIISIEDAVHHRFNSLIVVMGDQPMSNRLWYSLLKIANNVTVVDF